MAGAATDDALRETLELMREKLWSGKRREKLDAMEAAALMKAAASPLVGDLAAFLTSEDYVPCDEQRYDFSGHAPLAFSAMRAIESIGTAPDIQTMQQLLADPRIFILPEASYDQGAYIGDYSSEMIAPAGLAARLVPLMRQEAFALLPELAAALRREAEEIGAPARRAFGELTAFLGAASTEAVAAYATEVDAIAALPEATAPTTAHGFALRDLAVLCRKKIPPRCTPHN